jgi:hypothetical protein
MGNEMGIPHWTGSLVILALIGGFVVFAFRQGMAVKPRGSNAKLWWQVVPPLPPPGGDDPEADSPEWKKGQSRLTSAHDTRARRRFRPGDIAAAAIAIALISFSVYGVITDKWKLSSLSMGPVHSNFGPDWDCISQRGGICIKRPPAEGVN